MLVLALALPQLALAFAPAARADAPVTVLKLTVTGNVKGLPYAISIQVERGALHSLSVTLTRGTKVQEIHRFEFSATDVDFGIAASLSGAHLDTKKAMGRFGHIDVQVKADGAPSSGPLTCGDGTQFGSHSVRRGTVTGPVTLKADTHGAHYFGVVSNRGHSPKLTPRLDGSMSKLVVTKDCPGSPVSPCQPGLTLAATPAPVLDVALVPSSDTSGDTLTFTYLEDPSTKPATVTHSVQIAVPPGRHPFSADFKTDGTTAQVKASAKPYATGSGSFTGPAATAGTVGACTTNTSDGQFQGKDLKLHFDSVTAGHKNLAFTASVPATLVQTQITG